MNLLNRDVVVTRVVVRGLAKQVWRFRLMDEKLCCIRYERLTRSRLSGSPWTHLEMWDLYQQERHSGQSYNIAADKVPWSEGVAEKALAIVRSRIVPMMPDFQNHHRARLKGLIEYVKHVYQQALTVDFDTAYDREIVESDAFWERTHGSIFRPEITGEINKSLRALGWSIEYNDVDGDYSELVDSYVEALDDLCQAHQLDLSRTSEQPK